jgi:hypothetical protein
LLRGREGSGQTTFTHKGARNGLRPYEDAERFAAENGIALNHDARVSTGPDTLARIVNRRDLELRATPDGEWKHLLSFNADHSPDLHVGYSLDRRWIFYSDKDSASKDSLYRIPTEGGQPERLGDLPSQYQWTARFIHVSPDGRKILLEGNAGGSTDTWLLENFEPKQPSAK